MENITTKSGFVALIGRPNVGKSTLVNRLVGQKVAITSRKPQTTRGRIRAVYTCDKGQVVFIDTPGIHKAKTKLGEYMMRSVDGAFDEVDLIVWLVEPEAYIGAGDMATLERVKKANIPTILVINKIDRIKKNEVAGVIDAYKKLYKFDDIIALSAKLGRSTEELMESVFKYLPYGPFFFDEDELTDQPVRQMVAEIVREKALRLLGEEVPHGIAVTVEKMKERPDGNLTDIDATIICEKESHKGIIIGKGAATIKAIGTASRADIEKLIGTKANLQLRVKVRKGWRDSDILLNNYGYRG